MAKANKKTGSNNVAKKTTSNYEPVQMTDIHGKTSSMPSRSSQTTTGIGPLNKPAGAVKSNTNKLPTHKQIEDRAREIWQRKGCPGGQDEQNWIEAEAQLIKEMGIK